MIRQDLGRTILPDRNNNAFVSDAKPEQDYIIIYSGHFS